MKKSISPVVDKQRAFDGAEIAWYADSKILKTLKFCDDTWSVQGYLSASIAKGLEFPGADLYYDGIGYIAPAEVVYATFDESTTEEMWQQAYDELTEPPDICSLMDVCSSMQVSKCEHCSYAPRAGKYMFCVGFDAQIRYANEHVTHRYGYSLTDLIHMKIFEIAVSINPDDWPTIVSKIKEQRSITIAALHKDITGQVFPVEVSANHAHVNGDVIMAFVQDLADEEQRALCDYDQIGLNLSSLLQSQHQ